MEELIGQVAREIFLAADSSMGIHRLRSGVGVRGPVPSGGFDGRLEYRFRGQWEEHPRYGRQFAYKSAVPHLTPTYGAVVAYLLKYAPHMSRGRAEKLWQAYKADAVKVLRETPAKAADLGIMPLEQAEQAALGLNALASREAVLIELADLLAGRGFPQATTDEILRRWGDRAAMLLRKDPFRLLVARVPGAGFKRCDKLYQDLKLPAKRLKRQTLYLWHQLDTDHSGHTWLPASSVIQLLDEYFGQGSRPRSALRLGVRAGWLALRKHRGSLWVTTWERANDERVVAQAVRRLQRA